MEQKDPRLEIARVGRKGKILDISDHIADIDKITFGLTEFGDGKESRYGRFFLSPDEAYIIAKDLLNGDLTAIPPMYRGSHMQDGIQSRVFELTFDGTKSRGYYVNITNGPGKDNGIGGVEPIKGDAQVKLSIFVDELAMRQAAAMMVLRIETHLHWMVYELRQDRPGLREVNGEQSSVNSGERGSSEETSSGEAGGADPRGEIVMKIRKGWGAMVKAGLLRFGNAEGRWASILEVWYAQDLPAPPSVDKHAGGMTQAVEQWFEDGDMGFLSAYLTWLESEYRRVKGAA